MLRIAIKQVSPAGGGWGWLFRKQLIFTLQNAEPPSLSPFRQLAERHCVAT